MPSDSVPGREPEITEVTSFSTPTIFLGGGRIDLQPPVPQAATVFLPFSQGEKDGT